MTVDRSPRATWFVPVAVCLKRAGLTTDSVPPTERAYTSRNQSFPKTAPTQPIHRRAQSLFSLNPAFSWPPTPTVEDEKSALAKEYNPLLMHDDENNACDKGSVDQYPIILGLDESEEGFKVTLHCYACSYEDVAHHM